MLTDIRKKYPRVTIISHTDLDGYGSAAIMLRLCTNLLGYDMSEVDVFHVDYSDQYPLSDGFNIITDLSFNEAYRSNIDNICAHAANSNETIVWIDHHQTSVELLEKYPGLGKTLHVVFTDASATYLCWKIYELMCRDRNEYLTEDFSYSFNLDRIKNSFGYSIFEEMFAVNLPKSSDIYYGVPTLVRYTNDWDCFHLEFEKSIYYNTTFMSSSIVPKDVKHPYYSAFIRPPYETRIILASGYDLLTNHQFQNITTNYIIQVGRRLLNWQRFFFLKALYHEGYMISIVPKDHMKRDFVYGDLDRVDFVAIDRRDLNPVVAMPSFMRNHPWMLAFDSELHRIRYTVYCEDLENYRVNAKDVATLFGGGGHPGCSGFITDTPIDSPNYGGFPHTWKKDEDYTIFSHGFDETIKDEISTELKRCQNDLLSEMSTKEDVSPMDKCVEQIWWSGKYSYVNSFTMQQVK